VGAAKIGGLVGFLWGTLEIFAAHVARHFRDLRLQLSRADTRNSAARKYSRAAAIVIVCLRVSSSGDDGRELRGWGSARAAGR
jgi:hypothetical protein